MKAKLCLVAAFSAVAAMSASTAMAQSAGNNTGANNQVTNGAVAISITDPTFLQKIPASGYTTVYIGNSNQWGSAIEKITSTTLNGKRTIQLTGLFRVADFSSKTTTQGAGQGAFKATLTEEIVNGTRTALLTIDYSANSTLTDEQIKQTVTQFATNSAGQKYTVKVTHIPANSILLQSPEVVAGFKFANTLSGVEATSKSRS